MPDVDVINRALPPSWRRPANLVRSHASPRTVGDAIVTALAETLRRTGGCPGLARLVQGAHRAASGGDRAALDVAADQVLAAARGARAFHHVQTAVEVTRAMVGTGELTGLTAEEVADRIALAFLHRLVRMYLLDRVAPAVMQETALSAGKALTYMDECLSNANLAALARRLLLHEDGQNLRAPARRAPRRSTADLLHIPLSRPGDPS